MGLWGRVARREWGRIRRAMLLYSTCLSFSWLRFPTNRIGVRVWLQMGQTISNIIDWRSIIGGGWGCHKNYIFGLICHSRMTCWVDMSFQNGISGRYVIPE